MDYLWTPWRYAYVSGAAPVTGCIFCNAPKETDEKARIVYRGALCYVILNTFPYTSGHAMIVPYAHLDELSKLPSDAAQEMMTLTQRMEVVLRDLYRPDGINLGMNLGKAAGAGIAGHIHMHILPRWIADANFVSVIGETRVLPETLDVTWARLRNAPEMPRKHVLALRRCILCHIACEDRSVEFPLPECQHRRIADDTALLQYTKNA